MRAVVIEAPHRVVLREVPEPRPAPDEVIVAVAATGLCGTDLHIYAGEYDIDYPIVPGHEIVGTIVEVGERVSALSPGTRVAFDPNVPCFECHFCRRLRFNHCLNWQGIGVSRDGGLAERVAVPAQVIYPLADDMPFERAVFTEPLSCVVWGLRRAAPALSDRVLIFGAGPIGLLMLQAVRRAGAAQVVVTDLQPDRLTLATQLGANVVVEGDAARADGHPQAEALWAAAPYGYDVVIDATGVPAVVEGCFDYVTRGGKLLLFGVCPEGATIPFSPFEIFGRDITVLGSFAVNLTFGPALELLRSRAVRVEPLISHRFALEEFPRALEMARTRSEPMMKVLIEP
jgi:2-desacetyl-2-hydroxyethyl bacteriochlorophyllide A dehydrogenase